MASASDEHDPALIEAAQSGDRTAWDALVRRHDRWVRGVVYATLGRSGLVEDVAQQVWTQVWQQIGTLVDRTKWKSWLYRLARNAAIDCGKADARFRAFGRPLAEDFDPPAEHPAPSAAAVQSERLGRILSAVQALPAIYREPFILRHLEEWCYAEIGEILGLPLDTIETRLVRARRLLRESLKGESADA